VYSSELVDGICFEDPLVNPVFEYWTAYTYLKSFYIPWLCVPQELSISEFSALVEPFENPF